MCLAHIKLFTLWNNEADTLLFSILLMRKRRTEALLLLYGSLPESCSSECPHGMRAQDMDKHLQFRETPSLPFCFSINIGDFEVL